MNWRAVRAIYMFEMKRTWRTLLQSVATPVISTSLYFIVFGSAIGSRMTAIDGIAYGAYIIPGLILLTVLTESVSNGAFGIYMPRFTGTIYELLSAPLAAGEAILGYVGAAATKSLILALIILATARMFVDFAIVHPLWAAACLVLIALGFSLFGFILGLFAEGFEQLQVVPMLILTPLTFLGGTFYSIAMLPAPWDAIALANPVVYLVSALRWAFYGVADVGIAISLGMTLLFIAVCVGVIAWIFHSGYRLRS